MREWWWKIGFTPRAIRHGLHGWQISGSVDPLWGSCVFLKVQQFEKVTSAQDWCRHCVTMVQTLCQYGVDTVSLWCRHGVDTVSLWCRHCVTLVQTLCPYGADTVSLWCRHCVPMVQTLCPYGADTVSIWCRHCVTKFIFTPDHVEITVCFYWVVLTALQLANSAHCVNWCNSCVCQLHQLQLCLYDLNRQAHNIEL